MSTSRDIPEPTPARPWRPSDGDPPTVTTWPPGRRPALAVWSHGRWRYAPVRARQDWPDGRVCYQVEVDLRGDTSVTTQLYQWPQPGLRVAEAPRAQDAGGDSMPRPLGPRGGTGRRQPARATSS